MPISADVAVVADGHVRPGLLLHHWQRWPVPRAVRCALTWGPSSLSTSNDSASTTRWIALSRIGQVPIYHHPQAAGRLERGGCVGEPVEALATGRRDASSVMSLRTRCHRSVAPGQVRAGDSP
jgi:hypothetical protein